MSYLENVPNKLKPRLNELINKLETPTEEGFYYTLKWVDVLSMYDRAISFSQDEDKAKRKLSRNILKLVDYVLLNVYYLEKSYVED